MPSETRNPAPPPGPSALALPVIRPIPARTLVAGLSVIILLSAVFSYFVEVPRREYMSGRLEPFGGEIKVLALHSGTVTTLAPVGTDVERGELVASVVDTVLAPGARAGAASALASAVPTTSSAPARHDLTAPGNVTVLANAVTNGSTVLTGQLLSVLSLRDAPMQAVLRVPSRALAHMQPGQKVQLRLAAYPYETYGPVQAVVERLELSPLPASELDSAPRSGEPDSYYKATARVLQAPDQTVDGAPVTLQSGMQFGASVEVERRTLLAWVVWPLLKQFD